MIVIKNNPEVATAFRSEEVQRFFKQYLSDLEEAHSIKDFLIKGWETEYEDQINQLGNSFTVIESEPDKEDGYVEVERCIDGQRFRLGDMVYDYYDVNMNKRILPITRMYEDDRGLHVRLSLDKENPLAGITWRDLGKLEKV